VKYSRVIVALLICWAGMSHAYTQKLFYRYPSVSGVTVIDESVPPEAVPRGYDIIRVDGSVVKSVPAAPSVNDLEAVRRERQMAEAEAELNEKNKQWDEALLLRYSDIEDIEAAKLRAINDIKVRISILASNLTALKLHVESNQSEAAEWERRDQWVPVELVKTLNSLRREVTTTQQHIEARAQELIDVAQAYERDKARFALLQGQVEKRREYYAQPQ
jgi:hypothetical protein